jgi:uncharacterized protein (DUF433 family)
LYDEAGSTLTENAVSKSGQIGLGVYSIAEAARLTNLNPARLRAWFVGRTGRFAQKPLLKSDYERVDGDLAISFLDMVDAFVASQYRALDISLETLRRSYKNLSRWADGKHGFSHRRLYTDGRTVFWSSADERDHEILVDLENNQHAMPAVLLPFLESLEFDDHSQLASRWNIADGVVVDPAINFGKPIVASAGISTRVLAGAWHANGKDTERVAMWYDVLPEDVRSAVAFECTVKGRRAA